MTTSTEAIHKMDGRNGHITLSDEVVETVRVRLLRYLEINRISQADLGRRVDRARITIQKFASGDRSTSGLALDLIAAIPELGDGVLCPGCGRPMPGRESTH